jgi:hypothetical protein
VRFGQLPVAGLENTQRKNPYLDDDYLVGATLG